jgi:hypothetical protein
MPYRFEVLFIVDVFVRKVYQSAGEDKYGNKSFMILEEVS